MSFACTFWGVRGSIACPGSNYQYYGGNTSCVSVLLGEQLLIFDSGSGIKNLGDAMMRKAFNYNPNVHLFYSHTHWDHINGLPFFAPISDKNTHITCHAGHLQSQGSSIESCLRNQMVPPYFPVSLEMIAPTLQFADFDAGDAVPLNNDITLYTCALNHPNGATGYRIEYQGKSLCYVTDTEHIIGKPDQAILNLIQDADMVIYDSTYDDDEFAQYIGWGHSTWQEAIRLCKQANAKSLAVFHHSPDKVDDDMHLLAEKVSHSWDKAFIAREATTITL